MAETMKNTDAYIEALELAIKSQEDIIYKLRQEADDLSSEERIMRMEGAISNIKEILRKTEDVKLLRNEQSAEIARLKRIHDVGLELLKSVEPTTEQVN